MVRSLSCMIRIHISFDPKMLKISVPSDTILSCVLKYLEILQVKTASGLRGASRIRSRHIRDGCRCLPDAPTSVQGSLRYEPITRKQVGFTVL